MYFIARVKVIKSVWDCFMFGKFQNGPTQKLVNDPYPINYKNTGTHTFH